ncbi:Hypothetical Protein FCC1311_007062 [Hondaea fermentalgiana]|uniref:Uncharacterized protein n=1 Tax=Hondaea fermentalgiana TaxID=2315210 RepID=A0A2R5G3Y8_9STRA|nr:Hypothetical Protein FCC1311_007062 [Hondaea fermentalgiana]|eukprot:GBG24488.1 Hypothetical Protein FCC1311_007062 [Hondaea fermentalgiana]
MSALDRASYYLKKYGGSGNAKPTRTNSTAYSVSSEDDDDDSDRYLDPNRDDNDDDDDDGDEDSDSVREFSMSESGASVSERGSNARGLMRSGGTLDLRLDATDLSGHNYAHLLSTGSHGESEVHSEEEQKSGDNYSDGLGEGDFDAESIGEESFKEALKEIEREEEARRQEALRMMQDAALENACSPPAAPKVRSPIAKQSNSNFGGGRASGDFEDIDSGQDDRDGGSNAADEDDDGDDDDDDSAYEQAMREIEIEEEARRQEALRMMNDAATSEAQNKTLSPRSSVGSLHVEIRDSTYTKSREQRNSEQGQGRDQSSTSPDEESAVQTVYSSFDEDGKDGIEPLSGKSSHAESSSSPKAVSQVSISASRSGHPPRPVMCDSSTQHIEQRDMQVQANLVVSASGLVYEVPEVPVGAVEPTLLPPPQQQQQWGARQMQGRKVPSHGSSSQCTELATDRVMEESGSGHHSYTRYSDVAAYIAERRPKVRTTEEVMKENLAHESFFST